MNLCIHHMHMFAIYIYYPFVPNKLKSKKYLEKLPQITSLKLIITKITHNNIERSSINRNSLNKI